MTKGTILEVNVSELGLVTTSGKVVWSKYAQVTNNPENDGCVNTVLLVVGLRILLSDWTLTCSDFRIYLSIFGGVRVFPRSSVCLYASVGPYQRRLLALAHGSAGLDYYVHVSSILYNICISRSEIRTQPNLATSSRV